MNGWTRTILWTVGVLGVVFGVLRYFFLEFHTVADDEHGWANAPNLEPGDVALVWRGSAPHVGDMVRCPDPATNGATWYVGRVAGIGGDRIEFIDGLFRINNFRVATNACAELPRKTKAPDGSEVVLNCVQEELGGSKHDIYAKAYEPFLAQVDVGKLFLLSDNRNAPFAYDSRTTEVGQFSEEACKQHLVLRLWSKEGWGDSKRRMGSLF
ncbi:MAG: hypothetical protein NVSMB1_21200 [Polyangiales bacterium]